MPLYSYKVKTETGRLFSGETKIESEEELKRLLLEKGYTPVEIIEKNALTDISQISIFKQRVKVKDLAVFCRQFAIILQSGVPIAASLDVLKQQTTNTTLKQALNDIYENIQKGIALSNAMKQHDGIFPDILINMVEAGEISGQLDLVFERMAVQFEKDFKLEQKIKAAFMYPIIVSVIAIGVITILLLFVVPTFEDILTGFNVPLPIYTKILLAVSGFLTSRWYVILAVIIAVVAFISYFRKTHEGKRFIGKLAITLPVMKGLTRNIITVRLTRTLSTLMSSGVLLIQSMEVTQKIIGNAVIADKIDEVIEEIKRGKGLTQPLVAMRYFQPMVISMIRIGEESGNLDFSLDKSADFYEEEVETSVNQLTSLLEPLIMIAMSLVVAFVILAILTPMLAIYQTMSM